MKKTFVLFLVLTFILSFSGMIYAASTPKKGVVNTKSKNLVLRSGPSTKYSKITSLSKGTSVTITGVTGNWYHVTVDGRAGYVYASYVSVTESEDTDYSSLSKSERKKVGRDLGKSASAAKLAATVSK